MGVILLNILFVTVAAALGTATGWWLRGSGSPAPQPASPEPVPERSPDQKPQRAGEESQLDAVGKMMARLHQLTETVAEDVGQHNTRVLEINQELTDADGTEAGVIAVIEKLVATNEKMQNQLQSAESRLQDQTREIESYVQQAHTDSLTKLFNRRVFDEEMRRCEDEFHKHGKPACVLMLDVDRFKPFNDTYGHQAGDEVLRSVSRVLRKNATAKEVVCRYGGEEFAIIFAGSDLETARPLAEHARAAMAEEVVEFEGTKFQVTASAGLAQLQAEETADDVVKRADLALYASKEAGRNQGKWHDGEKSYPMVDSAPRCEPDRSSEQKPEHGPLEPDDHPAVDEPTVERRDRISGMWDRATFSQKVDRQIRRSKREGSPVSLLLVGVDHYTGIVEEYGDKAGEVMLRAAAQFVKAAMREGDQVARYDQSVFGLLLPGSRWADAHSIAERLRHAVQRCELPINGEVMGVTVSLGAAEAVSDDGSAQLFERAQRSLNAAKQSGGNCTFVVQQNSEPQSLPVPS